MRCRRPVACLFCGSFRLLAGIRSREDGVKMKTELYCEACGRIFVHQPGTRPQSCSNVAEKYQEPEPPKAA